MKFVILFFIILALVLVAWKYIPVPLKDWIKKSTTEVMPQLFLAALVTATLLYIALNFAWRVI